MSTSEILPHTLDLQWQILDPNFQYATHSDGTHIYRIDTPTHNAVDLFRRLLIKNDLDAHATNQHICSIYEFMQFAPTPYLMRGLVAAASQTPPGLRESIAIVVHGDLPTKIVMGTIRQFPIKRVFDFVRLCQDYDEALAWLAERRAVFDPTH